RPDLRAHEGGAPNVVAAVTSHLDLEVRPPLLDAFAAKATDLVLGGAEPACGRPGGRIARATHLSVAVSSRCSVRGEDIECIFRRERGRDVAEVDAPDERFGAHVGEQLPQRLAFGLGPQVPHGVYDGGGGEVEHALLRANPAKL